MIAVAGRVIAPTRFTYDDVTREGIVCGLSTLTSSHSALMDVLEQWNERDGWHDEPQFKRFYVDKIRDAFRVESGYGGRI